MDGTILNGEQFVRLTKRNKKEMWSLDGARIIGVATVFSGLWGEKGVCYGQTHEMTGQLGVREEYDGEISLHTPEAVPNSLLGFSALVLSRDNQKLRIEMEIGLYPIFQIETIP